MNKDEKLLEIAINFSKNIEYIRNHEEFEACVAMIYGALEWAIKHPSKSSKYLFR